MTKGKNVKITFDKRVYSMQAVRRVLSNYTESFFVHMKEVENTIVISMESKNTLFDGEKLEKEILNQVLEEDVRIEVESSTKSIREKIFEKAMNVK